jgi:VWFA-related protein
MTTGPVLRFLFAIMLLVGAGYRLIAQQTSDSTIRRTVRRVIVDVVVTDATQKPVRGLTRQDFSVSEDGKPQQVLSFTAHDLEPDFTPPKLAAMPPNTFVNIPSAPERGPLYVILLDLVNMEIEDQPRARKQLLKFIEGKPPGTRFAIFVLADGLYLAQGFTEDHTLLSAAVDPSHPRSHVPRIFLYARNYGKGNEGLMVSVFSFLAHFLDGLPGRKNLIWLAGGFPMSLAPREDDPSDVQEDIKDVLDTMARGQVAVDTIDVRGVVTENAHGGGLSGGPGATAAVGGPSLPSEYLDEEGIAGATGGQAFFSSNDIKGAFDDATEAGAYYYSLSYSPTNPTYDGRLRRINVELSKRGYHLAYRRTYYADDPDSAPRFLRKVAPEEDEDRPVASKPGDSLYAYMQHGAPIAHQLYFRAHVHTVGTPVMGTPQQMANLQQQQAYFHARRKNRPVKPLAPVQLQTYAIDYTVVLRQPNRAAGSSQASMLEFAVAAFDPDRKMLNGTAQDAAGTTSQPAAEPTAADANPEHFYRVQQQIDIPLNAVSLRVAVRDMSTDHIGAMEVALPLAAEPTPAKQAESPTR